MQQLATSTGSVAIGSVGQTVTIGCTVSYIQLISDGTNACNLQVYDGTSASGVMIASLKIPATTVAPEILQLNIPVCANRGIFTAGSGTGSSFIIHYVSS
jgi:hypothetical protein